MDEMEINLPFNNFFNGKRVLITGHTGFKGTWLNLILHLLKAKVYGFALEPNTTPSLYRLCNMDEIVNSTIGDIGDPEKINKAIQTINPEIVIHMAAQPLVRESYKNPVETYQTNVMGTVNLMEAIRKCPEVRVVINVTTDKVYENKEWIWGYRENEALGGYDPYSNSKACSELVTASYRSSYFNPDNFNKHKVGIATARAGNVIGGGDWAEDRLIPDFIRAITKKEKIHIRHPNAIRPWQHVLEPLYGYLLLAKRIFENGELYSQAWNFGPDDSDCKSVEWMANKLCSLWGNGASYLLDNNIQPHEAHYLKLDCSKSNNLLEWRPKWDINSTLQKIVAWNKAYISGEDVKEICIKEIQNYYQI